MHCLKLLKLPVTNFLPCLKTTKYFNIQKYDFKEINVSDR